MNQDASTFDKYIKATKLYQLFCFRMRKRNVPLEYLNMKLPLKKLPSLQSLMFYRFVNILEISITYKLISISVQIIF